MASTGKGARLIQPEAVSQAPSLAEAPPSTKQSGMEEKALYRPIHSTASEDAVENEVGETDEKRNGAKAGGKKNPAQPSQSKEAKIPSEPHQGENLLWSLSPELLDLVLSKVQDRPTIRALGLTCKALYSMLIPRLHHRVSISSYSDAEVVEIIRTLGRYMDSTQKTQLNREVKFKNQQDWFPTGLDEKSKPLCASWVMRLAMGPPALNRNVRYIVSRCVEEALRNLENLETVQCWIITKSITQGLASLKNLKVLDLSFIDNGTDEDLLALAKIKGLKHFKLSDTYSFDSERRKALQTMIINSASTLESLCVKTCNRSPMGLLLLDWAEKDPTLAATTSRKPVLTALRSLSLDSYTMGFEGIDTIFKAIDFTQLVELRVCRMDQHDRYFLRKFVALVKAAKSDGTGMKLRHLCVEMWRAPSADDTIADVAEKIEEISELVSCFDSLESLKLENFGEYPRARITTNPGLANSLLQAILRNKNLKTLKISHNQPEHEFRVPYLSPESVGALIDGLHLLQNFEFAPKEGQITGIAQSLSRGAQLTSIVCFPYYSWKPPSTVKKLGPHHKILRAITNAFLNSPRVVESYANASRGGHSSKSNGIINRPFVWEHHCKLKVLQASKNWELASRFPEEQEMEMTKPEQLWSEDGKRQVWYREFNQKWSSREKWLNKVSK